MLSLGPSHQYYLYRGPTDMRKGFDGLSGLVRTELGQDPLSGDVFIFVNRRRDRLKLLLWDRSGYVIWYKRLEAGRFELPLGEAKSYPISWDKLVMILEGIALGSVQKRKRFSR
ncbi:MAG: IS66 family insertion sequence element accessory protein TnpB [Bacteroidia bacterium]